MRVISAYINAKGASHAAANTETFDLTSETSLPYSADTYSIAQTQGKSQEADGNLQADEMYYNLSEDARTFFGWIMQKNKDAPGVREAFYKAYLRGYTGKTLKTDADSAISESAQRMVYEMGMDDKAAVGTFKPVKGASVSKETAAFLSGAAKDLNCAITYGGKAPVIDGLKINGYITQTGAIHIFEDAEIQLSGGRTVTGTDAAVIIIAGHELTHRLQQLAPKEYARFCDMAVQRYGGVWYSHEYANRLGLSETKARDEMAADFAMEKLFTDTAVIEEITKKHSKIAQIFRNILQWIKDKLGMTSDIDTAIRLWNNAYNAAVRNIKADVNTSGNENIQFSINPNFETVYDNWSKKYGRRNDMQLLVETTSEALQSTGVKEQNIYWDTTKINDSLKKHSELNDPVMKQVPDILENPVIILESHSLDARIDHPNSNRIVMLGEVYGTDGVPIMAVLELEPRNRREMLLQQIKLVSTYSRVLENTDDRSALIKGTQNLIDESTILYIDPQKNRTNAWLRRNRLQLPFGVTKYGSINKVSYLSDFVNSKYMQISENDSDIQNSVTGTADIRERGEREYYAVQAAKQHLMQNEQETLQNRQAFFPNEKYNQQIAETLAKENGLSDSQTYPLYKAISDATEAMRTAYLKRTDAARENAAGKYKG